MKKLLDNFKIKVGSHCGSTLMSDILCYYGHEMDEDMCFGIGSGLGFLYHKAFSPPMYMILGRNNNLEEKIGLNMGFLPISNTTLDNDIAWLEVKHMIDQGDPAIVDVDSTLLPYMQNKFNLFDYVRYGGHRACIIGYDDDKRTVLLADYAWSYMLEVDMETFAQARSSNTEEFPSQNLWYHFYFPEKLYDMEQCIINGIRQNVNSMTHPAGKQMGLNAMNKFVRQVTLWTYEKDKEQVCKNAYIAYMMLETVGTGGGNFRRIYARFLREAGMILKDDDFLELSKTYFALSKNWSQISKMLLASSKDISSGIFAKDENIQKLLNETYELEKESILKLGELINMRYS